MKSTEINDLSCRDLHPPSYKSIREGQHRIFIRFDAQLVFHVNSRVFDGVGKFFHTTLGKNTCVWTLLCVQAHCHVEQDIAFLKLLPQSCKHTIVKIYDCGKVSLHSNQEV